MRLQDPFLARYQIIGVILHERGSLRVLHTLCHDLHEAYHRRRLPVAFSCESIPLLHQPLDRKPRQLSKASKITEMCHDRLVVLRLQESLEPDLDSRLHRYMLSEFLLISAFQKYLILIIIFFDLRVNISFGNRLYFCRNFIHRICVDLPSELDLRLYLIALGNGNIPHIIRDPHDTDVAALDHADRRAHPGADLFLNVRILPVSHDDLPLHAKAAEDVSVLSVSMRRLVLVHEVHVNGVIWNLAVELRMEVKQRLSVLLKSKNP